MIRKTGEVVYGQVSLCLVVFLFSYATPVRTSPDGGISRGVKYQPPETALLYVTQRTRYEVVFYNLLDYLRSAGISGDYVETGVHTGNSAVFVAKSMVSQTHIRKMWLYDSWQGMPQVDPAVDGDFSLSKVGWGKEASAYNVRRRLVREARFNVDQDSVFREGWFNSTFLQPLPETVAFLHIDSDWYESVMSTLLTFYDRVPPGGVVVFDDYGHWEGCRNAFYDFFRNRSDNPLLERNGHTQAWFVKGLQHNRDGLSRRNKRLTISIRQE